MKRACTDCGKVGNRIGALCKACAIGAPEDLTAGDWVSQRGVQVWVPHELEKLTMPSAAPKRRGRPPKVAPPVIVPPQVTRAPVVVEATTSTEVPNLAALIAERNDYSWFTAKRDALWDDSEVTTARRRRVLERAYEQKASAREVAS